MCPYTKLPAASCAALTTVVPGTTSTPFNFSVPLTTLPVILNDRLLLTAKPVSLSDAELSASANAMCVGVMASVAPSAINGVVVTAVGVSFCGVVAMAKVLMLVSIWPSDTM